MEDRILTLSDIPVIPILLYMAFVFACIGVVFLDNYFTSRRDARLVERPPITHDLKAYRKKPLFEGFWPSRRRPAKPRSGTGTGHE